MVSKLLDSEKGTSTFQSEILRAYDTSESNKAKIPQPNIFQDF